MNVLKIVATGPVTSFRYPHFVHGVQPTYDIPPPATLYGHICSALGERVDPASFRIGLHFTFQTRWHDYEHIHLFGRNPKLSPFERELLFQPRLTLYLDRPDWLSEFRTPRYLVTLGRSQDLMCYESVAVVSVGAAPEAYIEHSLLPISESQTLTFYRALNMPRYISPSRDVDWQNYAHVTQPQRLEGNLWIDHDAPRWRNLSRAVYWLSLA